MYFVPSRLDRLYSGSPAWLQHLGVSAFGLVWKRRRYGGRFQQGIAHFAQREGNAPEEWQIYQNKRLREMLAYAIHSVPHYRDTFDKVGVDAEALVDFTVQDLGKLPLVCKEDIRRQPERFLSETQDSNKLHTYHTSGTTGTPLAIKFTSAMHQTTSAAYEVRCRRWAGVNYRMSRAMIGGRLIVPKAHASPPFWRYNIVERQLYMSAFHISPTNVQAYVDALNRYHPDYLVGYASAHFFLARVIHEAGLVVHRPRAVLTSSEKLLPHMRAMIEQVYRCRVFDAYSGVEWCCLASECECHNMHLSPDVGVVEILDATGHPVAPGTPGEIVATGLLNFAQPLIRYRTGDVGIVSEEQCPCGRRMPILKELIGRLEDTVLGSDGREMVRFHGIFVGIPSIKEGQIVQEALDRFHLRLVTEPTFDDSDRAIIQKRFAERLGPVDLTIKLVDQIERTENGKFRSVISKVHRNEVIRSETQFRR
jgi:phenylacetate-CoA ligase